MARRLQFHIPIEHRMLFNLRLRRFRWTYRYELRPGLLAFLVPAISAPLEPTGPFRKDSMNKITTRGNATIGKPRASTD